MTKLLLIDDDILEHKMFRCYLGAGEGHEFELRNAINMEKAVSLLTEGIFDWVFLDDRFAPYKSVLETLPLLQPYLKRSKVIVISSSIEARHLQSTEDLGVHAVIDKFQVKPFLETDILPLSELSSTYAA